MSLHKVVWQEGMLLRPQHFQQNDRYYDHQLKARTQKLGSYAWGFLNLEIDRQFLNMGKLVLSQASGILPDGTLFELGSEREPLALDSMSFEQPNFWTSHFGGIYVFRDVSYPAAICMEPARVTGTLPIAQVIGPEHRNQIADWLQRNNLVESIISARGLDTAALLRQKMDFILVDAAEALGLDLDLATRQDLRQLARQLGSALPEAFRGLADLLRWVETGGHWPEISSEHPAYFYTLRAAAGPERDLVNMLLADLAPLDVRQLFICHKELFYRLYSGWSDRKRGWVAEFLAREYAIDKAGARAALFGPEPGMEAAPPPAPPRAGAPGPWSGPSRGAPRPSAPRQTVIDLVGPWGAVGGRNR